MKPLKSDPDLFTHTVEVKLAGISGCYVDDLLREGNKEFRSVIQNTHERFEMDEDEELTYGFSGFIFSRKNDGTLNQPQNLYLDHST